MTHHHEAKKIEYEDIYYLVGLIGGLFTGVVIEGNWLWIPILGIVGVLFTAFFLTVFVRGRADA
jgi:hypothetical protein